MAAFLRTIASTLRAWRSCVAVAVFAGNASVAIAQTASAPSEPGFQPNRDYLELQPFEQIDTASGNIVLTFADLVLPGNSGRELRFERVFNNRATDPSGLQWRFGISGVPMKVFEKARPSGNTQISTTIQGERFWAPYFPMLDGSNVEMTFVETPDAKKSSTQRWVQSPSFLRYDRDLRNLHFPDGTIAHYTGTGAAPGDLERITDPYGNTVTLSRSTDFLRVVQSLARPFGRGAVSHGGHSDERRHHAAKRDELRRRNGAHHMDLHIRNNRPFGAGPTGYRAAAAWTGMDVHIRAIRPRQAVGGHNAARRNHHVHLSRPNLPGGAESNGRRER